MSQCYGYEVSQSVTFKQVTVTKLLPAHRRPPTPHLLLLLLAQRRLPFTPHLTTLISLVLKLLFLLIKFIDRCLPRLPFQLPLCALGAWVVDLLPSAVVREEETRWVVSV